MKLQELITNVQQWSIDRGLDKADSKKQLLKLYEEFGELAAGIAKGNIELVKDSIGDCVVVLIILAQQQGFEVRELPGHAAMDERIMADVAYQIGFMSFYIKNESYSRAEMHYTLHRTITGLMFVATWQGLTFEDSLQQAWDEIKDRKGKLVDGIWVKEEDLK